MPQKMIQSIYHFHSKEGINMNKIYKVIWSKAKHTYVVASEIAKGHTKGETTGRGLKRLAAALLVAAALLSPNFAWAADTATVELAGTGSTATVEVYTTGGTDTQVNAAKTYTYRKVAAEAATREAKDNELNERITNEANAIHDEIKAGDEKLDARITNVKEYLENQTVSKTDAAVQDGAIVKADKTIGENVTNLDAALAKETAARIGADKAQDAVIQQVNQNAANGIATLATAYNNEVASREAADNELNERITNEANAIHDTTNQLQNDLNTETAAREAGDTALDTRITNVKEYLEKQTSDNYVSKADAAVQDGAIVKAAKTIGENVTNLDAALTKETAARIGADKAQDKVIEQVNQNMVDGFNTINKNMSDGFTALSQADANELAGRMAADTKLVEATNGGLSLDNDNVLQKTKTKISSTGEVTTSKEAATTLILNKGAANQVKIDSEGVTVGTSSTQMDAEGFTAGGHDYDAAGAALMSDGRIKGANGDFTVDTDGNVASGNVTSTGTVKGKTLTDGAGASMSGGTVTGTTLTDGKATISNGNIKTNGGFIQTGGGNVNTQGGEVRTNGGKVATSGGEINTGSGAIKTVGGDILTAGGKLNTSGGDIVAGTGDISGQNITATGAIQGKSISDGTATMQNGNLTGVKNLSAETITTSGDATIGGDLTVKGKLNVDEIDLTKSGIVDGNNVTASTKVAAGEITGYKKATSTKDGSEKESAIDYDENGTSTWAIATDADKKWNKSTLTVEGSDVTSKVIDSDKNSNISTQTASESNSTITGTADGKNYKSYITQNLKNILQKIEDGDGHVLTSTEQTETGITNTAANGTITNDAKALVNKASDSITSQIGDGSAVKSVMDANGIANTATGGTISNSAANISNTTTGNMTNTVGGNLIDTIMGTSTTTVTGKVTEDYKSDLSTKVGGDETHAVTGNQTTTVSGNRTVNVKGTETENFNAQVTNVKTDQKTSVGGNQTNIVGGDQQNTVSGSKTETVKGSVTEKYGSQATTVNGDQSTNIGGNQTTVVAKDQTNTVSGKKTETVKGAVNETYGSQTTKVNGDQSTTVTGKQTNSITGDQVNTIGGNQTTTVTGDSSLSAKNITNTATEKLSNSAAEIENMASKSIKDKVGDNVSRTMTTSQIKESVVDGANSNTSTKTSSKDMNIVTDGTSTSTLSQLANSVNTSLKEVKEVDGERKTTKSLSNVKTVSEDTTKITDTATGDFSSRSQKANGFTSQVKNNSGGSNTVTDTATTSEQKLVSGNIIDILKDAENGYVNTTVSNSDGSSSTGVKQTYTDITSTAKQGTITNDAKNLVNKAEEKLSNSAAEIENTATNSIKDTVGKSTVTTTTDGTTFENRDHNGAIGDYSITKTTISGNTLETGKATMDYAEVMKDLRVGGTTTTKDLHVTNNATIDGTLGVTGAAKFQDTVTVAKDLSVGGNATVAGDVTADSYKVGDKTYIDGNGINANNQVIRNVGKGDISEGSTDAVSGGQLYETNTRVSGLETRMGTVETRVDKLDNKIDKVGANAAAMANLHPLEFDEDSKWNVAAAVGSSGSETASAVGVFYRPNENVMVNASAAMGTGENMFGGGVSLRLGHGGNKAKEAQMKAAAAENKELRAKVDDLTARMDALLSVLNPNMSKDFPDVPENHWAYEAVSRLAGNGIVEGYEDGRYHGERQMTRYEMAEIIYNALSKGAKAEKKLVEEFRPELQAMAAQKKA